MIDQILYILVLSKSSIKEAWKDIFIYFSVEVHLFQGRNRLNKLIVKYFRNIFHIKIGISLNKGI